MQLHVSFTCVREWEIEGNSIYSTKIKMQWFQSEVVFSLLIMAVSSSLALQKDAISKLKRIRLFNLSVDSFPRGKLLEQH